MKKVAVIGAGISGLTLAKRLGQKAVVSVFEKSHKVSGRIASRNIYGSDFDHGAQFFYDQK